jgi:hypothetical protein
MDLSQRARLDDRQPWLRQALRRLKADQPNQALQERAAAILVSRGSLSLGAAAVC